MFTVQIIVLLMSIVGNYSIRWIKKQRIFDSYLAIVLLSIGVFLVMFLGELMNSIFPASIIYGNGIIAVLSLFVLVHVVKITD